MIIQDFGKPLNQEEISMILIGEIQELLKNDKYPSIKTFINKPMEEKEKVVQYMNTRSEVIAAAPAIVRDVLNPEVKIPELLNE